ncbi:MAG: hypothetical protein J7J91_05060, partial [Deltaproteobacteria bacterium]|nr:hypothetical protein [Deltaproteobacteria bacterium]
CDSANITSAKIKAILDTGSLTAADKIAALLDGDSLTAADAATHVNSGTYTDALMASAFDSSYLAAAKAASIFNDTNLTLAKAASIFEDENLSLSKIGEIIIHDNISDSRVQEILNETDYETRALTGVSAVINVLSDDWADNKLASRDNRATTPSSIHEENEFSQKFRPEWSSSGDATAANNRLELGPADGEVHITPYINLPKKWEHRWYASSSSNIYYQLFYEDDNNFWASKRRGSSVGSPPTIYCELYKMSGGTSSTPISDVTGTWGEYAKITRDENGNWEVFHTGGSVGTTIDTWLPTNNYFRIWHDGSEHNALVTSSWFKIYDSI